MKWLEFKSKIDIIGVNPYVELPEDVLKQLFEQSNQSAGPIPVRGRLNGQYFKQTVVKYSGLWRLYINGLMRRAAKVDVGSVVAVMVQFDPESRAEAMNFELEKAFASSPKAKSKFDQLAPYRQKEILRYLNSLKSPQALGKNVARVMAHLLDQDTDALHALMHRKK